MNYLSLFSGVGGGDLAFQHLLEGFRCVGYVEIEEYCQEVIKARTEDGLLDLAPIFDDIRTFNKEYAKEYKGMVELIIAGFPCQPFSIANRGKSRGEESDRNLWPDTLETIRNILPKFVSLENVSNLLVHEYFGTIIGQLSEIGSCIKWKVISANEMGAPHKRDRVWISFANSDSIRPFPSINSIRWNEIQNYKTWNPTKNIPKSWSGWVNWFSKVFQNGREIGTDTTDLGIYNGIPYRLDAIRALGNAQVPIVAATAWEILKP